MNKNPFGGSGLSSSTAAVERYLICLATEENLLTLPPANLQRAMISDSYSYEQTTPTKNLVYFRICKVFEIEAVPISNDIMTDSPNMMELIQPARLGMCGSIHLLISV